VILMIKIPSKVKKMILGQQMIVVASVDKNGISNISPRTTFTILDDVSIGLSFSGTNHS